jgi:hypothetical protein
MELSIICAAPLGRAEAIDFGVRGPSSGPPSLQFGNDDDAGREQIKRETNKQHCVLLPRREYQTQLSYI